MSRIYDQIQIEGDTKGSVSWSIELEEGLFALGAVLSALGSE